MARSTIWKGVIRFGEIEVPVKLHTTVKEERVEFHLLHGPDSVRLRQQMVCAYDKQPVPAEEQTKGFEVEKGKFLIVDPAELEPAAPEGGRTIEVHEFVRSGQVDPFFLDRAYSLEPDGPGARYGVLADVLQGAGAAGICTWTMRKRSYFGVLQARGSALRLTTLRHADEVVPASALGLKEVPLADRELQIGSELIGKLSTTFEPSRFENEHEKKLRSLIDRKIRGETVDVVRPRELQPTGPDHLLEALEASLKKAA
jgi:DNA end-binding protein Ku